MAGGREIAVVAYAESHAVASQLDDVEMLVPVIHEALAMAGVTKREIGFTCSGSCDFLGGRPFSFVHALDALGAWPPIEESHVEMDGAFALYEAWVRLHVGDIDLALVYAFGKASQGSLRDVLVMQLDPYTVAPLWPDSIALGALQARALLDTGRATERDMAERARRRRNDARSLDAMMETPYRMAPLRDHDIPRVTDGVCAMVMATGERARKLSKTPAFIRGIDHRIEPHSLGARDLTRSVSTTMAGQNAGALAARVDVAELHAPFSHQELILEAALSLGGDTDINPSGGALRQNPMMVAGLARIGHAATRILDGAAKTAIGHATSGPCLQQNLVCLLGSEP